MSRIERIRFQLLVALRALTSFLDLFGILAIGVLTTSVALMLTGAGTSNNAIEIGAFSLSPISAESVPWISIGILLLFITKAVLSILLTKSLATFIAKIEARASRQIAQRAFGSGLESSRLNSREEILFAVQSGSPSAFNSLLNSTGILVGEGFLFVLVIVSFALVDLPVAIGAILYFGLIAVIIQFFVGRLMYKTAQRITESTITANSALSDLGEVIREASILGRRDYFYDLVYKARMQASGSSAIQFVLTGMPRYIVETALILGIAIFVLLQAASGDLVSSAATLGVFLSGGLRLTASLLPLQSALISIKQSIPPATRALDFLDFEEKQDIDLPKAGYTWRLEEAISVNLSNVTFSYKDSETESLREFSLDIAAGSQAAIIGVSGSGKSTIADLILGLLSPSSGKVLLNGETPQKFIRSFPGALAYVPQKPGMVSGTIAQNIALGIKKDHIDLKRMSKAVSDAQLEDFLATLPEGLQTNIGKRKDELSGGQIQRIGLARALYTEPKLLVMDEATSALDAESENHINQALEKMRGKVTVILIAHRLNTVQNAQKVFLIEGGNLADTGTFQELLDRNDVVKNLARLMAIRE